jgi:16S rRNA (guanine966-N2)-methyltransferase
MASAKKSRIRIIGGKWRGRKLDVVAGDGLRPTPDRVRETLFAWLAPFCHGAAVLDCCAGSGALGLEALSRGASSLVALEQQPATIAQLRETANRLDAGAIEIIGGDVLAAIAGLSREFDLVFIDPPYARPQLRKQIWEAIESQGCLRHGARIYFEWPTGETFDLPSPELHWSKHKTAGQVNYAIAEWRPSR